MSDIKQVREMTGLSQSAMAAWLGVSKGLLQFAEKGQRSLPTEANKKMTAILILAKQVKNTAGSTKAKPVPSNPGKLAEGHRRKMEVYRRNAETLKLKLAKLRQLHPQLHSRMALIKAMRNSDIKWYSASPRDKKWMELTEWFSNERLPATGLEEQELLEDRIDTCLAYAELHRKRLEKYEGMMGG